MGRRPGLGKETSTSTGFPERHSSVIAPAGHHCNVRSGHLNATFGGKDMGSMAQTGLLLVPSDALGHTWALPGVLGAGQGLPPPTGPENLNRKFLLLEREVWVDGECRGGRRKGEGDCRPPPFAHLDAFV